MLFRIFVLLVACTSYSVLCSVNAPANFFSITNGKIVVETYSTNQQTTWSLSNSLNGNKYISDSPLPVFRLNQVDPITLETTGEVNKDEKTTTLTLNQKISYGSGISLLKRYFQLNGDHPVVRLWYDFEVGQTEDSFLTYYELLSLSVPLPLNSTRDDYWKMFVVDQWNWPMASSSAMAPKELGIHFGTEENEFRMGSFPSFYGSLTQCSWAALQSTVASSTGLFFGLEFNGKTTGQVWLTDDNVGKVMITIDNVNHTLSNSVPIAAAFIGVFNGDWDDAAYVSQKYVTEVNALPLPDERYPFAQYDSWSWGTNINEEIMMKELEVAYEIGLEVFVLDLGWATDIGNWIPDPMKFPRGLKPLVDKAHSYGMLFGLHMPLAQMSMNAPIIKKNPDWLAYDANDYFNASALCLGHKPARYWLLKSLLNLVDTYSIDYFVQDGEDMVKHCTKNSHTHNVADSNVANSLEGVDWIWSELRKMRSHIILENCEDGGVMLTHKIPTLYHTSISVDDTDTQTTRLGVYGMSYPFPPRYSARYLQDKMDKYTFRSSMFGGPLILQQQLSLYNSTNILQAKEHIKEYKKYRNQIRDGKVIHLQRPSQCGEGFDAIQSVAADASSSLVFVFRGTGGSDSWIVKPRGLRCNQNYTVTNVDSNMVHRMSGCELSSRGLEVKLLEKDSAILEIKEIQ